MSWSRDNSHPFRRSSLNSIQSESTAERKNRNMNQVSLNRSDSKIEVKTPVQDRLRRLQGHLKEEQIKKGLVRDVQPAQTKNSFCVNDRLKPSKSSQTHAAGQSHSMEMGSPKKPQLKRRSDHNHNNQESKKSRLDKSPSPRSSPRKYSSAIRRSSSRTSLPGPPEYDNDVEMTDSTIQEEISTLREATTTRGDYSLSMTINAENKLVIKFNDFNDDKSSALQKRLISRQMSSDTLHIVVDTNIFIKDLSVLTKLMKRRFPEIGGGFAVLVIPYIVLKELENLAHRNQGKPIEQSAKAANKFINSQFTARNPQLKGQNATDHKVKLIDVESGDDDVLNCCLQVKSSGKKVILLSNDVNLRNKALFNDVPSYSIEGIEAEDLQMEIEDL